jgi:hypothetical protein
VKVTGTCIRECIETTTEIHSICDRAELLYTNQPIPSPPLMPAVELLLDVNNNNDDINEIKAICHVLDADQDATTSLLLSDNDQYSKVDLSGKRINTYMKIINVVQQLDNIRQIATCYSKTNYTYTYVNHLPMNLRGTKSNTIVRYYHSLKALILQHNSN